MLYISKGMIYKISSITEAYVSRCGGEYVLNGSQTALWLAGRFHVAYAENTEQQSVLRQLDSMGLAEVTVPDDAAYYRLLTNCVICPVNPSVFRFPLNKDEKLIWKWVKTAGFKLTVSELVYLCEQNITPRPAFFGKDNRHILIHAIYTRETIFNRILAAKMEESPARNRTVSAILGLLRKKRIILI